MCLLLQDKHYCVIVSVTEKCMAVETQREEMLNVVTKIFYHLSRSCRKRRNESNLFKFTHSSPVVEASKGQDVLDNPFSATCTLLPAQHPSEEHELPQNCLQAGVCE